MGNNDTDFFVSFSAGWCAHCKAVEPVLAELAVLYRNDNHVKVGRMDMTRNEA